MRTALTNASSTPTVAPQMAPATQQRAMSVEGSILKTAALFGVLLVVAAGVWFAGPAVWFPASITGSIAGLVLGLVLAFKKQPSPVLSVLFAVAEGAMVGGFSAALETQFNGIVGHAVLATLATLGALLALFSFGKIRTSPKLTKVIVVAAAGYALFSLINFGLVAFGIMDGFGVRDFEIFGVPLGVPPGIVAVLMAAYFLVMDFEQVKTGVENRMPSKFEWVAAYSLLATLVWMYVEFVRLLTYFLPRD